MYRSSRRIWPLIGLDHSDLRPKQHHLTFNPYFRLKRKKVLMKVIPCVSRGVGWKILMQEKVFEVCVRLCISVSCYIVVWGVLLTI